MWLVEKAFSKANFQKEDLGNKTNQPELAELKDAKPNDESPGAIFLNSVSATCVLL